MDSWSTLFNIPTYADAYTSLDRMEGRGDGLVFHGGNIYKYLSELMVLNFSEQASIIWVVTSQCPVH